MSTGENLQRIKEPGTQAIGPFGLSMGLKVEEIAGELEEIGPCKYRIIDVPKKHSAFECYVLQVSPVQGLAWIKAIGYMTNSNSYGHDLQTRFDEMREKLERIYGKSQKTDFLMTGSIWNERRDWMQAVAHGERFLSATWESGKLGVLLPNHLSTVFLNVNANDSYSGFIAIEYAFENFDASDKEISLLEDDSL